MKRHLALALVIALLAPALVAGQAAANPASCTTDTSTSYCEQVPSGVNAQASSDGFVLAEASMGVILGLFAGFWVLRKAFQATGWGTP